MKAHKVKDRNLYAAWGVGEKGQRKLHYAKSEEEALRKARDSFGLKSDGTLYHFYHRVYLPTVAHRSENYLELIGWAMDKYIIPRFGAMDVRDIKRADVQSFFNSLTVESKGTIKTIAAAVFKLAVMDEIITSNPVSNVRLPRVRKSSRTSLTPEELNRLFLASTGHVRAFVLLTGYCGLRPGEALGVTKGAVKGGCLTVERQAIRSRGGMKTTGRLKTDSSYRTIPLPKEIENVLSNGELVVCGGTSYQTMCRWFAQAVKDAKITEVTPHELRHTFISIMESILEAPRPVVMALAGHAGRGVTDGYSHAKPEQLRKWMERFWEQVSAAKPVEWRQNG